MLKALVPALSLAAVVLTSAAGAASAAPSFSCRTARLDAEIAVCSSRYLSRLDRSLDSWYQQAKLRASYFDQTRWLRGEQRIWLDNRNSCGSDESCLESVYLDRIGELRRYAEHV